jgi:hypothetical protein
MPYWHRVSNYIHASRKRDVGTASQLSVVTDREFLSRLRFRHKGSVRGEHDSLAKGHLYNLRHRTTYRLSPGQSVPS